jgi:hypothetical protein
MFPPAMRRLFAVLLGLAPAMPFRVAVAQRAAADTTRAAASLRPGTRVRIAWPDGAEVSGRVVRQVSDSLVVWDGAAEWPVALGDVRGLWVARWRATAAGARAGAVAGGAAGGLAGVLFGAFGCEGDCGRSRASGTLAGLASGAVVGGLAGAAVGMLLPRWRRVVP